MTGLLTDLDDDLVLGHDHLLVRPIGELNDDLLLLRLARDDDFRWLRDHCAHGDGVVLRLFPLHENHVFPKITFFGLEGIRMLQQGDRRMVVRLRLCHVPVQYRSQGLLKTSPT